MIEVEWGQLPEDFSRGNVVSAPDERVPDIPHPDRWRVAPIGLRLPWLVGTETVSLVGMRADLPRWDICLPAERPVFVLPDQPQEPARMWQLFIDADARRAEILWGRSWFMDRELMPGEDREWLKRIALRGERLT
ncbi:DUF2169 domain-containing protein [Diaphorobacter aerolatus]|uniref:DUF2169 domain-containing protein n=1 Tax=Diaphorobacter aerolatus TaxID=1288495 RepID=A0A7H0GLJ3_9BURK|nr:DUF2169 domain-containing protein [Diaphorobacter aerolatus]QNP49159.1 DUF2169 domain-containing protein [Diaphorobacter aerolatus]